MRKFLTEKWFVIAVVAIATALTINMTANLRNNFVIRKNTALQKQTELVKQRTSEILTNTIHGIDLGVRGFALTKDDVLLDPYTMTVKNKEKVFQELEALLQQQNYDDLNKFKALQTEIDNYITFCAEMVEAARQDDMEKFTAMLKQDKGYDVWVKYAAFAEPLIEFENNLNERALASYNAAIRNNLILQIAILVISLPVLFLIVIRIQRERKAREVLLIQIAENDRKFVFNPGTEQELSSSEIIEQSILNTRKASDFIKNMANNNYDVTWEGLNDQNEKLNQETLAGDLINMREQLKKVKAEDEKRNWMNEGLAKFSEIVRNHQHDSQVLADKCVSFLTNYLKAQQASLFIREGEENEQHLQLASCYAFDKKKWVEKRIDIGYGLVGQAFLEGDTIQLKEVPQGYTAITSGLGDATPGYVVIVPLKYDIQTVAIVEMAAFTNFEEHHVTFLKKAGEFLASAILNSQNTQKMKTLLEQAKVNQEEMLQREEEMRQNMEELQATQEELVRKEKEMQKRLAEPRMN